MNVDVLPFVLQCFDVEAQCWGDGAHILSVKLLQDGRFPRVVQTSEGTRLKKEHANQMLASFVGFVLLVMYHNIL